MVLSTAWLFDVVTALRAGTPSPRGARIGYVVAASVATYSHYIGVLLVGLQAAAAALLVRRRARALATLAGLYGLVLVAFLPCLYRALRYAPRGPDWIREPTLLSVWNLWLFYFNRSALVAGTVLAIGLLALARTFVRGGRIARRTGLLVAWLVLPVVGLYAYSHLVAPRFLNRVLMIAAPPAYLLLARALSKLPLAAASASTLLALLLVQLVVVQQYYVVPTKEQFRETAPT